MILWLIMVPLVASVLMIALGRWRLVAAPLSAAALAATGLLALAVGEAEMIILGRSLSLSLGISSSVGLGLLLLSAVTLFCSRTAHAPHIYSLTLGATTLLIAGVMVRNMMMASLLLAGGAVLAVMLVPTADARSPVAAMRALIQLSLAMLLLLASAWALEQARLLPGSEGLARFGAIALVLGSGISLATVPFDIWLAPVTRYGHPLAVVLLTTLLSTVTLVRYTDILAQSGWTTGGAFLSTALSVGGILTAVIGGLATLGRRTLGGWAASLVVADLGIVLTGIGLGTPESTQAAVAHLSYHVVGISLIVMALSSVRLCLDGDDLAGLHGLARRAPLSVLALAAGGLCLAGWPPLGGFASRFALYRVLAFEQRPWAIVLVVASFGPAWSVARSIMETLRPGGTPDARREPRWWPVLMLPFVLVLLLPGVLSQFPQWLPIDWVRSLLGLVPHQ